MSIEILICTYNRAASLDEALAALAGTRADGVAWTVTVVDNNSTDGTAAVVDRHRADGRIPGLQRVTALEQGLTPARLTGVRQSEADWVAFVDDDCRVAPDWLAAASRFLDAHPACAILGSRIVLDWEEEPTAFVRRYGWALAEHDRGGPPARLGGVPGTGMIVRREALVRCGWTGRPVLADRVGRRLVSGGDVEICARVAGGGGEIWYEPACVLAHAIPASRMSRRYLARIVRGLGASSALGDALVHPGGPVAWTGRAVRDTGRCAATVAGSAARALLRRRGVSDVLMDASFNAGRTGALWGIALAPRARRRELLGRALRPGPA